MKRSKFIVNKIYWFLKDFLWGLWCGYPFCCVREFTWAMWKEPVNNEDLWQKKLIRNKLIKHFRYSPCEKCFQKMPKIR